MTQTQTNPRGEPLTVKIQAPNGRQWLQESLFAGHYDWSVVGSKFSRREAESLMRDSGMENCRIIACD